MEESFIIIAASPQDALLQLQEMIEAAEREQRREARWYRYQEKKAQREIQEGYTAVQRFSSLYGRSNDACLN